MSGRGADTLSITIQEKPDSLSHRGASGTLNALNLLAQASRNGQSHDEQNKKYVDNNTLPSLTIDPTREQARDIQATQAHDLLQSGVKGNRFELGAEAEAVAWKQWQVQLNGQIGAAIDRLAAAANLPADAKGNCQYRINADGSFQFVENANNREYAKMIRQALQETFRNHPELLKFPNGSHKSTITRSATFGVSAQSSVRTGDVPDEQYKF